MSLRIASPSTAPVDPFATSLPPPAPPIGFAGARRLVAEPSGEGPGDGESDPGDDEGSKAPEDLDPEDDLDKVDEASRESFPASDPPAFTPLHIGT